MDIEHLQLKPDDSENENEVENQNINNNIIVNSHTLSSPGRNPIYSSKHSKSNISITDKTQYNDNKIENDVSFLYMLNESSDDALGHRAREVFREAAASRRELNGLYYFLQDIINKYGKILNTVKEKVLYETDFINFFKSGHSLIHENVFTEEEIHILFYKIDHNTLGFLTLDSMVYFFLLDKSQILIVLEKYGESLAHLKLSEEEIKETFIRLTKSGTNFISIDLFNAMIFRELDICLTSGETTILIQYMDYDHDGLVLLNDFVNFIQNMDTLRENLIYFDDEAIVDIQISKNEKDETELRSQNYHQLSNNIQYTVTTTNNKSIYLWYKKTIDMLNAPTISMIQISDTNRDSDLVSKGFHCLNKDINNTFSKLSSNKEKYLWISYASILTENLILNNEYKNSLSFPILEIAFTNGSKNDQTIASLRIPPCRGFKRINGNLHENSGKQNTFMWIRRDKHNFMKSSSIIKSNINIINEPESFSNDLKKTSKKLRRTNFITSSFDIKKIYELEIQVKNILRKKCPLNNSGEIQIKKLFEEFDIKKKGNLSEKALLKGMEKIGIIMEKNDFQVIWKRMNIKNTKKISFIDFNSFLELGDAEIDNLVIHVQKKMIENKKDEKDYRNIFKNYCSTKNGYLSRDDFRTLLITNQSNVASEELTGIFNRFDSNRDGLIDYVDFLRFLTNMCDQASRKADRIIIACEEILSFTMEHQNKKKKLEGNIDSSHLWKLLKDKEINQQIYQFDQILRSRNKRFIFEELKLLTVIISPVNIGKIDKKTLHEFINHKTKKRKYTINIVKNIIEKSASNINDVDKVYERLNIEKNGKLTISVLYDELKKLSNEKKITFLDIKDFVHLVLYTGSYIINDKCVLIDRFLNNIRNSGELRFFRCQFITLDDSKNFINGIKALRQEIRKAAKTLDGKLDYSIPFKIFDKDQDGFIILSEFEARIRDLGILEYMNEEQVKTLMRRFDIDNSGGINLEEFIRFAHEGESPDFSTDDENENDNENDNDKVNEIENVNETENNIQNEENNKKKGNLEKNDDDLKYPNIKNDQECSKDLHYLVRTVIEFNNEDFIENFSEKQFYDMDPKGVGYVSISVFLSILKKLKLEMPLKIEKCFINVLDTKDNGEINYKIFLNEVSSQIKNILQKQTLDFQLNNVKKLNKDFKLVKANEEDLITYFDIFSSKIQKNIKEPNQETEETKILYQSIYNYLDLEKMTNLPFNEFLKWLKLYNAKNAKSLKNLPSENVLINNDIKLKKDNIVNSFQEIDEKEQDTDNIKENGEVDLLNDHILSLIINQTLASLENDKYKKIKKKIIKYNLSDYIDLDTFQFHIIDILKLDFSNLNLKILIKYLTKTIYTSTKTIDTIINYKKFRTILLNYIDNIKESNKEENGILFKSTPSGHPVYNNHEKISHILEKIYKDLLLATKNKKINILFLFENSDKEKTGFIDITDFHKILQLCGCHIPNNDIKDLENMLHLNNGNKVNYISFLDCISKEFNRKQELKTSKSIQKNEYFNDSRKKIFSVKSVEYNNKNNLMYKEKNSLNLSTNKSNIINNNVHFPKETPLTELVHLVNNLPNKNELLYYFSIHDPSNIGMMYQNDFIQIFEKFGIYIPPALLESNDFKRFLGYNKMIRYRLFYDSFINNGKNNNKVQKINDNDILSKNLKNKIENHILFLQKQGLTNIKNIFEVYDIYNNGKILIEDFLNGIQYLGFPLNDKEIQYIIRKFRETESSELILYNFFLRFIGMPIVKNMNGITISHSNNYLTNNDNIISYPKNVKSPVKISSPYSIVKPGLSSIQPPIMKDLQKDFETCIVPRFAQVNEYHNDIMQNKKQNIQINEIKETINNLEIKKNDNKLKNQNNPIIENSCPICYHVQENDFSHSCEICGFTKNGNNMNNKISTDGWLN